MSEDRKPDYKIEMIRQIVFEEMEKEMEGHVVCPACGNEIDVKMPKRFLLDRTTQPFFGWRFRERQSVRYMQDQNKKSLICAEIGVREGKNAIGMLEMLDIKRIYLVDPYLPYKGDTKQPFDFNEEIMNEYKRKAKESMQPFKNKAEFVYEKSEDASELFDDGFFDFVYIDADHLYHNVKKDIEAWWPKVKKGGVLGGHDFDENHPGVIRAVEEFNDTIPELSISRYPPDWWVVK